MNVLVDTSVWVDHFKQRNERLAALLEEGQVVCHPHVVTEVACGTPPNRRTLIAMLADLESTPLATNRRDSGTDRASGLVRSRTRLRQHEPAGFGAAG